MGENHRCVAADTGGTPPRPYSIEINLFSRLTASLQPSTHTFAVRLSIVGAKQNVDSYVQSVKAFNQSKKLYFHRASLLSHIPAPALEVLVWEGLWSLKPVLYFRVTTVQY